MIDDTTDRDASRLGGTRQVTIDALCEHFANDAMSVEEFERRVDAAHQATTADELRDLLRDLPGGGLPVLAGPSAKPAEQGAQATVPAGQVRESGYAVAVLGGVRRGGRWTPARVNTTIAVCGGAALDFREAALAPGVTELRVFAVWGGVEIIVPPGLDVESHGVGILGGFEHVADSQPNPDPSAPRLRISGAAVMGGVDITVRQVGESARDARRRRRHERRRDVRDEAREIPEAARAELRKRSLGP